MVRLSFRRLIIAAVLLVAAGWFAYASLKPKPPREFGHLPQSTLVLGDTPLIAVVVRGYEDQEKGLGGIEYLPSSIGMLFAFEYNSRWGIWMKDMKIPIDILWLKEDGTITYLETDIHPETYPHVFAPQESVRYVLEVASGTVKKTNLKIGDKISVSHLKDEAIVE